MAARERLTLAEGLLATLTEDPTLGAVQNARRLLESQNGDMRLTLGTGHRPADPREIREVKRLLSAEISRLRPLVEAPVMDGPRPAAAKPAAPAKPASAAPKVKAKARGGSGAAKPTDPNDPSFEKLHPRAPKGRVGGGQFAQKGDGMGDQPDDRARQLQERLSQLGFKVQMDGRFGGFTEQAVKSFQEKYGLPPTGKVDQATVETLRNPPPRSRAEVEQEMADQENPPKKGARSSSTGASEKGGASAGGGTSGRGQSGGSLDTNDPEAVKAFQRSKGLDADGIVGDKTRAAMGDSGTKTRERAQADGAKPSRSSRRSSGALGGDSLHKGRGMGERPDAATKALQGILEALGYGVDVDGRFGPDTEKAVKKLQRRYGLKADGIVGRQTKALLKRAAKRHAKDKANLDTLKLATEDTGGVAAEDGAHAIKEAAVVGRIKRLGVTDEVISLEAADIAQALTMLAEGETDAVGTAPYNYAYTSTAGRGPAQAPADPPRHDIEDWRPERGQQGEGGPIPDWRPTRRAEQGDGGPVGDGVVVDVMRRLRTTGDRLAEAVIDRMRAQDGRAQARALARERVLRERMAGLRAEAEVAGIDIEEAFSGALHPRDRYGRWREVMGLASRMHTTDAPKSVNGFKVAKISDAAGKPFVVAGPDGKAVHAKSAAEVADIVSGTTDMGGMPTPATQEAQREQRAGRYGEGTLTHHVPGNANTPARTPLAGADPADFFDLDHPHEMVPVSKLRLSKPPESQPASVDRAEKLMAQARAGGTSKRKPISGRLNPDGTVTVLDGNATSGVAIRNHWKHIPVTLENA